MGPTVARLACAWLLAASLLCSANARDGSFQGPDGQDEAPQLTRKLLAQNGGELGCPCSHEAHVAGECPCHLDTTWLDNDECPSCPVYACGDCDPLKCDECKRCCDGAVLSEDRKICSCPACDIPKCLECDAEDCSKCLVCEHGYKLGVDRKCEVAECPVPYCEKCQLEDRYKCDTCIPYTIKSEDEKSCICPECAVSGCEVCNPKKCDECNVCVGNLVPVEGKCDTCNCTIPHCVECTKDCDACNECKYGYKLIEYNTLCEPTVCSVDHCKECDPMDGDQCWQCEEHYRLKDEEPPTPDECHCNRDSCLVPNCAVCSDNNCSSICYECDIGCELTYNGTCECPCRVPGCKVDGCPDDPGVCTDCKDGHKLVDGKCVCDPCDIPYCDECQPDECSYVCNVCTPPYVVGYSSDECLCDQNLCDIAHCDICDPTKGCGTCYECAKDYMWNGTHCVCDRSEVDHCKDYCEEDCTVCTKCYPPYELSEDGNKCVCGADVDHCLTYNEDDCTCNTCEEPLQPAGYPLGSVCGCGDCGYGCSSCEPPYCTCTACEPPLVFNSNTSTCECPGCYIPGCEECDPADCTNVCKECEYPKVLDEYGNCRCPDTCDIENCAKCSETDCGTCDACDVFYKLDETRTECKCSLDFVTSCTSLSHKPGKCGCDDGGCVEPLVNVKGFCFFQNATPGCDWYLKVKKVKGSCADVCSRQGKDFKVAVVPPDAAKGHAAGCFGQFEDTAPEGMRPGINFRNGTDFVCKVEKGTGQEPAPQKKTKWKYYPKEDRGTCRGQGTPAYACICEKEKGLLKWAPGPEPFEGERPEGGCEKHRGGCQERCQDVYGLQYVALPGGYQSHTKTRSAKIDPVPYAACSVDGEIGYNVDDDEWCGYCLTPTKSSKEYHCLCGNSYDKYGDRCPGQGPYSIEDGLLEDIMAT